MKLDKSAINDFKNYIVQSMNDDVYYQLKHWVHTQIDDDQDTREVLDFFVDNLDGSLQWID